MKVNPPPQKKELCAAIVHFIYENQIVGHVYKFSFKCPYFSKSCLNRFPHSSGCYVFSSVHCIHHHNIKSKVASTPFHAVSYMRKIIRAQDFLSVIDTTRTRVSLENHTHVYSTNSHLGTHR
jgi:hypothetical protein